MSNLNQDYFFADTDEERALKVAMVEIKKMKTWVAIITYTYYL